MIKYEHQIIILLKRVGLLLLLFTVTRLLFFSLNYSEFNNGALLQLGRSFFYGIRFDLSVVYYCNLLFIVLSIVPFSFTRKKQYQFMLKMLFVIVNVLLLGLNVIDMGYFPIVKRRSGWDMLTMLFENPETIYLTTSYIMGYWYLVVVWASLTFLLVKYYPKLRPYKVTMPSPLVLRVTILFIAVLSILGGGFGIARGLEGKPLRLISANKYVEPKYIPLLLNTPFSILNTMGHKIFENREYLPYTEIEEYYSPIHKFEQTKEFDRKNIVLIVLESFSTEYIFGHNTETAHFAPFIDSLIKEGLYCSNAVANSSNSRDALPAILAGVPSHNGINYMGSRYSTNVLTALPTILKEQGYSTSFFHGGHNGTMSFDKFSVAAGIENYYGYNEYLQVNNNNGDDGAWGIYDSYFVKFVANELDAFQEPFFTTLFTLSSHDPYPIPDEIRANFPEGKLPILKSIAYADYSLKLFFESVKNKDWYNNTLFVVVADHTSQSILPEYGSRKNSCSIPLLFFAPGDDNLRGQYTGVCQQADIMPTVLDYINYDKKFLAYGKSVFRKGYRFAVNFRSNYNVVDSTHSLIFDGEKTNAIYNYRADNYDKKNLVGKIKIPLEKYLKAYLQDYEYRMTYNKLSNANSISDIYTE